MELARDEQAAALAGGPGTATIGPRTFLIDHYTTALVFTVFEWAINEARRLYNPVKELLESMKGLDFPDGYMQATLLEAAKVKLSGEVPGELVTRVLRSVEGVAFQLWALTRTHHPDFTYGDCKRIITEENRIDAYVELDRASGANIVVKAVADAGFFRPAS